MQLNKIKKISLSVLIALSVGSANASVTIIKEHDVVNEKVEARFSQVGLSGEKAEIIHGYGEDMPLNIAMDIIIPRGWYITKNEGADQMLLNWSGDVSWPYVLKNVSEKNNISVTINWEKKSVDLFSHQAHENELLKERDISNLLSVVNQEQENMKQIYLLEKEKELKDKYALENKIIQEKLLAQKEAEKENALYIKKLEAEKELLAQEKAEYQSVLENYEKNKDKYLTNNSDVPQLHPEDSNLFTKEIESLDIEALKKRYDDRYILPLDSSFEFFIKGGYAQDFDYFTPATFISQGGQTLSKNLNAWIKQTGWDVKWDTDLDYIVEYDLRFEGNLKEAATSLILLYNKNDDDRKLDIDFYPMQELIVISDLKYK
jgi:hypothetical protein